MIYIHIPFCRSICNYCDFHHTASLANVDSVVRKISEELHSRQDYLTRDQVQTIYFGGGTPSVLRADQIGAFIQQIKQQWGVDLFREVTIEANPDDITADYATALLHAGVDRISLGVQSFNDQHLQLMNRRHSANQAIEAVETLQKGGFDNVTIDLIYAMPFLSDEQWSDNLKLALELGVQHISAYHLTIEAKTAFGKQKLTPVDDSTSRRHFQMLREALLSAGFEHYEVSNFALSGLRAIHNGAYWDDKPYLGVGPAAHSYNGTERSWNVASNRQYLAGAAPQIERLSATDKYNERLMTRLRTSDGLANPDVELIGKAQKFIAQGTLAMENDVLRIPAEHFLISDYIISDLFL